MCNHKKWSHGHLEATSYSCYHMITKSDDMVALKQCQCNVVFSLPHENENWLHGDIGATSHSFGVQPQKVNARRPRGNVAFLLTSDHKKVIAWQPWGDADAPSHSRYRATTKVFGWRPWGDADAPSHSRYHATTKVFGWRPWGDADATSHSCYCATTKVFGWRPWGNINTTLHSCHRMTTKSYCMATLRRYRCNDAFPLLQGDKEWFHGNLEVTLMQCRILVDASPQNWSHSDLETMPMQSHILVTVRPRRYRDKLLLLGYAKKWWCWTSTNYIQPTDIRSPEIWATEIHSILFVPLSFSPSLTTHRIIPTDIRSIDIRPTNIRFIKI